jgi:hypothetical protein
MNLGWLRTRISTLDPLSKKILGVIFVFWGISAIIVPFIPGSYMGLIGLELLELEFPFASKLQRKFEAMQERARAAMNKYRPL